MGAARLILGGRKLESCGRAGPGVPLRGELSYGVAGLQRGFLPKTFIPVACRNEISSRFPLCDKFLSLWQHWEPKVQINHCSF